MMDAHGRKAAWLAGLGATVALTVWSQQRQPDLPEVAPRPAAPVLLASAAMPISDTRSAVVGGWTDALKRETAEAPARDLFQAGPPEPPAAPAAGAMPPPRKLASLTKAAPAKAVPPPPAFRYLGRLAGANQLDLYLDIEGQAQLCRVGDLLPGGWRLEKLAANVITFLHPASGTTYLLSLDAPQ